MATSVAGVSISTPTRVLGRATTEAPKVRSFCLSFSSYPAVQLRTGRMTMIRPVAAAPDKLDEKVAESIKSAEQACSEDPASGECVAAWDEVEELSAAASHKRDGQKKKDPLEVYCDDNPETDECRTYDN